MKLKHFLQFNDLSKDDVYYLFQRAKWLKDQFKNYKKYWPLEDRTLVMIFEKASTRTRLSFESGMQQLGGSAIYLNTKDSQKIQESQLLMDSLMNIIHVRFWLIFIPILNTEDQLRVKPSHGLEILIMYATPGFRQLNC